ncbi:snRNA activating protein complex subunit, putative [Entamoeba nuttalli P19]|uniref:snRNA activating protein complex subunit, putative n=2 Tax=Entamoeba nuttalli TaxID=412467 RepID=K2HFT5_ENTNP|nr:snRNA activating protein complex subunit, putative [Entamoeba nuttalli P19]EKE41659.1 snRNA activating protein complex subunit, putative [Entamoeba nuttalli P19]|eukprot:XP_008856008.1 snRNA activating protein complex subunit, putative [Entamoeba nuttalli P19]
MRNSHNPNCDFQMSIPSERISTRQYSTFSHRYIQLINFYSQEHPSLDVMKSIDTSDVRVETQREIIDEAAKRYEEVPSEQVSKLRLDEIFNNKIPVSSDRKPNTQLTYLAEQLFKKQIVVTKEAKNSLKEPLTFTFSSSLKEGDSIMTIKVFDFSKKNFDCWIEVKTTNTISELRTVIPCLTQKGINDPDFIFINDTFYTSQNNQEQVMYNLVEWREYRNFQYSRFPSHFQCCIEDFELGKINIEIDEPYLYGHLLDCEHIFIISDIRVPLQEDKNGKYPRIIFRKRKEQQRCNICDSRKAEIEVTGDSAGISDPSYYCKECFSLLHNDMDIGFEKRDI